MVIEVAQFTAKSTNSEKTVYFLSLTPCSINKMFSEFTFKKIFLLQDMVPRVNIYFFFSIFINRFYPLEKFGVTQHCLYRDLLTLSQELNDREI